MNIVVVGDTIVDARTPQLRVDGADLVARMLQRDGHRVHLVTAFTVDAPTKLLREYLAGVHIVAGVLSTNTTAEPKLPHVTREMLSTIASADALIVSDHGRAITDHPEVRIALHRRGARVPLVWDPHPRGATPVPSAWLVTPNLTEAVATAGGRAAVTTEDEEVATAGRAAARLREHWGCIAVAVTLGNRGALFLDADHGPMLIAPDRGEAPGVSEAADPGDAEPDEAELSGSATSGAEPRDSETRGAGDRFAASALLALAAGDPLPHAVRAAVVAARDYVASGGERAIAGPVSRAV